VNYNGGNDWKRGEFYEEGYGMAREFDSLMRMKG
jgi:hypothetical protein